MRKEKYAKYIASMPSPSGQFRRRLSRSVGHYAKDIVLIPPNKYQFHAPAKRLESFVHPSLPQRGHYSHVRVIRVNAGFVTFEQRFYIRPIEKLRVCRFLAGASPDISGK